MADYELDGSPRFGVCQACGEAALHSPHPSGKWMCENCKVCHPRRQTTVGEFEVER